MTATDTEVGKTFVSGVLLKILLENHIKATYFKPVATGCEDVGDGLVAEDLVRIRQLTGLDLHDDTHCPYRYFYPLAPLAAARLEGHPIQIEKIHDALRTLMDGYSTVVVEGVGGVLVPITEDTLLLDLIQEMRLPTLVVARPGLGTINHTLLTIRALQLRGIPVIGFVTNGKRNDTDLAQVTSPSLIEQFGAAPFLGHVPLFKPNKWDFEAFVRDYCDFFEEILF